ncbi:MAG TPA: NfeD family protein [Anaerolineaceae bacterium]|jgi:membrane-bound serine protease (ClpP class)
MYNLIRLLKDDEGLDDSLWTGDMLMNILIDPNITYVILVGGLLMAILALFAPGTGVIEIGALFALVIAGYGIYHMPINYWALAVLLIGVFPFLLALRKSRHWYFLVVSLAALIIGSAYLFDSGVWWRPAVHPLLAAVVSILAGLLIWLVASKGLEAMQRRPTFETRMQNLIGAIGEAKTTVYAEGSVYVGGEMWSAYSGQEIPAKTRVRVVRRDGFVLEVEKA